MSIEKKVAQCGKWLEKINTPKDLKKIASQDLKKITKDLRQFIIDNAALNGGHFGASLGVVELTVALHYVFDTPNDKIVWDVGHQAYGHKILTERKNNFHTNRTWGGLSGFTKPTESEYDAFIAGHASISISAALGMAVASRIKGEERKHIAVIGDGALTGGAAFEGLNNAGDEAADILVILNDNQISIDPNVGALKNYLVHLTTSKGFNKFRSSLKDALKKNNYVGKKIDKFAARIEKSMKNLVFKDSNFFEALNFRYFGPVDGHNVEDLVKILIDLKSVKGPKILHVLTKKGKGFAPAEKDQIKWHATNGFNAKEEILEHNQKKTKKSLSSLEPFDTHEKSGFIVKYQEVFGYSMIELAQTNKNIIGVTPAMPSGSSLDKMMKVFPDRVFDVGIAEGHAVTFSAGLAKQGLTPFCNIYSTFAQRAYDQIIHDVCIDRVPVIFCLDRGGLVGEDGETHQGMFDLAYLRIIPNLVIGAPMDERSLRNLLFTAAQYKKGPLSIRYPRGLGEDPDWQQPFEKLEIGKGRVLRSGKYLAVLSLGAIGQRVSKGLGNLKKQGVKNLPAHFDMIFLKPLDEKLLHAIFKKYQKILTVEEGVLAGGFGSAIFEFAQKFGYQNQIERIGLEDTFISHGSVEIQRKHSKIDQESIEIKITEMVHKS